MLESITQREEVLPQPCYRLCYVADGFAYFTTQSLDEQWGDDWEDTPYEHNAGEPYQSREGCETPWEILKVAFSSDYYRLPHTNHHNSPFSVRGINAGAVAWIFFPFENIAINAGESLPTFIQKVELTKGTVYLPRNFTYTLGNDSK